jgi:hypothetical protein
MGKTGNNPGNIKAQIYELNGDRHTAYNLEWTSYETQNVQELGYTNDKEARVQPPINMQLAIILQGTFDICKSSIPTILETVFYQWR